MNTDPSKQYLITAAPQCPFPDKWMGPQIQGSALEGNRLILTSHILLLKTFL